MQGYQTGLLGCVPYTEQILQGEASALQNDVQMLADEGHVLKKPRQESELREKKSKAQDRNGAAARRGVPRHVGVRGLGLRRESVRGDSGTTLCQEPGES